MLGVLFLPLIMLGVFEVVVAMLLLSPLPVARPVLGLAKQARTPIAWTVVGTVSVILLVFAVSSAVEIGGARRVHGSRDKGGDADALHHRWAELHDCMRRCMACRLQGADGPRRCRHSEVSAWLSLVLTTADLLLIFVLQKLAAVLSDREQMKVSQGALLKQVEAACHLACQSWYTPMHMHVQQGAHACRTGNLAACEEGRYGIQAQACMQVQGLHSEYERLRLESEGGKSTSGVAASTEAARLQSSLQAAQRDREQMGQELQGAQRARRTAEANVEALKSQTKACAFAI